MYFAQTGPRSAISFVTAPFEAPVIRQVERMPTPSTRAATTAVWRFVSMRFMMTYYA